MQATSTVAFGPVFTSHYSPVTIHRSSHRFSAFPSAEAARGMLAHFSFFVKKLGAQLAQLFTAAMLQLVDEKKVWRFVFHGCCTSGFTLSDSIIYCL
jgi:hypothetical protein